MLNEEENDLEHPDNLHSSQEYLTVVMQSTHVIKQGSDHGHKNYMRLATQSQKGRGRCMQTRHQYPKRVCADSLVRWRGVV